MELFPISSLEDAMEAQSRQLMEQSMAFQQQYGQYGYAQPSAYNTIPSMPPMMPYGASAVGYPQGAEYYAQQPQTPYDPSLQQQPQPPVEMEIPNPSVVAVNGSDEQPAQIEQKPVDTFDMQRECFYLIYGDRSKVVRFPRLALAFVCLNPHSLPDTRVSHCCIDMVQSLAPPMQPSIEYAQPGDPPVSSTLVDQMPAPPSDDLGSASHAPEGENGRLKPPTPQLICLE